MIEETRERRAAGATPVLVHRRDGARSAFEKDALVVEEPLEIRLREGTGPAVRLVVTMRTPGDDEDLTVGLLFGEGVIASADEILSIERPEDPRISAELARNVAVVTLAPRAGAAREAPRRATVMGSACGVCGRTSIEDVLKIARGGDARPADDVRVAASVLTALPEKLRGAQAIFTSTGGLHAAGLFGAGGDPVLVREDVGRHNAADKAIGAILRARRAPPEILLVSGRLAFEIVQKAVLARIPVVAAVSAPTSLAVELAEEAGVTLVGFLRGERFNVYTHPERIVAGA
jgi:FdhD protein